MTAFPASTSADNVSQSVLKATGVLQVLKRATSRKRPRRRKGDCKRFWLAASFIVAHFEYTRLHSSPVLCTGVLNSMNTVTRRRFLHSSLWAGTGLALGTASAAAIEPIRRSGPPHLRLSIAAYSFRQSLVDYQHKAKAGKTKPAMTLDDFIDLAAGLDLDAVELTAYYFPQTTPDYLAHLKGRCTRLGLDISGTAVGNNFCVA